MFIGFYSIYHCLLNAVGEVMRFADRKFYSDWWWELWLDLIIFLNIFRNYYLRNSDSIFYFWKTWNVPTYKWCQRHILTPLIRCGLTKFQASCFVFLFSAVFHEFILSIAFNRVCFWFFISIILQIPLSFLVKFINKKGKNMAIWVMLILGGTLLILLYYNDYLIKSIILRL